MADPLAREALCVPFRRVRSSLELVKIFEFAPVSLVEAGRMCGLFRLDPTVLTRDVELIVGPDAVVEARVVLVHIVGRR